MALTASALPNDMFFAYTMAANVAAELWHPGNNIFKTDSPDLYIDHHMPIM
jgi:hypothetical protein